MGASTNFPWKSKGPTPLAEASSYAAALAPYRAALRPDGHSVPAIEQIKTIAHGLAGAGGIFGFPAISEKSAALARAAEAMLEGTGAAAEVEHCLNDLLGEIERE